MNIRYIEVFDTIDQCVACLMGLRKQWTFEDEQELKTKMSYKYKDTLVMYDPHHLLEVQS